MKIEVRYARMYKEDMKRQIAKDAAQVEWNRLQAVREAIKAYQDNERWRIVPKSRLDNPELFAHTGFSTRAIVQGTPRVKATPKYQSRGRDAGWAVWCQWLIGIVTGGEATGGSNRH
jgi:hypothetical protein